KASWWLVCAVALALALLNLEATWRLLVRSRLWLGLALHMAVVATFVYGVGWGPLLGPVAIITLARFIGRAGARAVRPGVLVTLAAIAAGQLAVSLGWAHTYLPGHAAHT